MTASYDYSRPLQLAIAAALEAGRMLREEFHRPGGPRGGGAHAEMDEIAERAIRERLLTEFPWRYRGEETGSGEGDGGSHLWLVDPNDGTTSFLRGRRGSAVCIAALRDGQPVLGVVYAYAYPDDDGDLLAWAEGCGPVLRNGRPLSVDLADPAFDVQADPPPVVIVSRDVGRKGSTTWECLKPARFRTLTSIGYRLALVAAGEADAAVSLNTPVGWDYGAGHALLRGSGGLLLDEQGREVAYTVDGRSGVQFCFGGRPSLVQTLCRREWGTVLRATEFGRHILFPDLRPRPGRAVADAGRLARAQGCLLGQLAGDSLGGLVEFRTAKQIRQAYPAGIRELSDGGTWNILAGQPTDDSELALLLARTLVREQRFEPAPVLGAYVHWYQSSPFDCGGTIAAALGAAAGCRDSTRRLRATAERAKKDSQANGSLMRISPLGIFAAGRPEQAADGARADSRLTHPHPVCQDACAAYVAALATAIDRGSAQAAYQAALAEADRSSMQAAVRDALTAAAAAPPADFQTHQGWVLIALQNAFYQLLHAPSLEAGVIATVQAGGDTDTNAAIAGALLGAVHGRQAVPPQWVRALLACRPLPGTPTRHPRPTEFWPVDALELAEALLLAGEAGVG